MVVSPSDSFPEEFEAPLACIYYDSKKWGEIGVNTLAPPNFAQDRD